MWVNGGSTVGFNLKLTDEEPDGKCVYWQVQGVRNNALDAGWERLTTDTCGAGNTRTYNTTKNIRSFGEIGFNGYRVRICKNINNAPDVCSEPSRVATRGLGSAG